MRYPTERGVGQASELSFPTEGCVGQANGLSYPTEGGIGQANGLNHLTEEGLGQANGQSYPTEESASHDNVLRYPTDEGAGYGNRLRASTGGDTGHANRLSYSNEAGARQANGSRITLQERDRTCYHIYSDENADEDVSQRVVPHHQGYGGQPFNLSVQETGLPGISCVMPPRHSPISDDQINAVSSTNQNKRAIQYDCSVQELTLWNQKLNGQVSFLLHCISLFEISLFCAGLHVPVFQAAECV